MLTLPDDQPLSPTIASLKRHAQESFRPERAAQRAAIYTRVYAATAEQPPVLQAAQALAAFLAEKDLVLHPDDLLAGHIQRFDYAYPVLLGAWEPFVRDPKEPPAAVPQDLRPAANYPAVGPDTTPFVYRRPDGTERGAHEIAALDAFCRGVRCGLYVSWPGGHLIPGFDRLLALGFGALAAAARNCLADGNRLADGNLEFARASLIVCEAATNYVLRYAQRAAALADASRAPDAARRLARIADACRHVATEPPRTFFEALQLLWLGQEIAICEHESGSLSLGRLDQYLDPWFRQDVDAGALDLVAAAELVEALWCKFGHLRRSFQNVTLGGRGPDGAYAADELTYLCLRATRRLRMDQPLLSVRWSPDMPAAFWDAVLATIETGTGFPALFNDGVAIAAKAKAGVAASAAENYGIVGCVELAVPGREYGQTEGLRVNWAKVLELMLNDGACTLTGERLPLAQPRRLDEITSCADFFAWYRAELAHFLDLGVRGLNLVDAAWPGLLPTPYASSLMAGCLAAGLDVTAGGTQYNLSSVNGLGMADVADSLVAIDRLVFRERCLTLPELAETMRRNYAGAGSLAAMMAALPHYGNDLDEPDQIVASLAGDFCRQVDTYRNPRGGRFQSGMYSVDQHARRGKLTGALPSGRHAGVALANALSSCQGRDTAGPTALVLSATKADHTLLGNGMVLDLKFHPSFFEDASRRLAFRALVEAYFDMGGLEIQFNVISRETLLCAQRSPQDYRDLLVRVSGFSAYFIDLDRVLQDEIIARTEHAAL
jgi:pyruvate formate-lyase/glycerol dehydratase family glycyl radical enzyme